MSEMRMVGDRPDYYYHPEELIRAIEDALHSGPQEDDALVPIRRDALTWALMVCRDRAEK
jgi:hypothetical protein